MKYAFYLRKVLVYVKSAKGPLNRLTIRSSVLIVDRQIHSLSLLGIGIGVKNLEPTE